MKNHGRSVINMGKELSNLKKLMRKWDKRDDDESKYERKDMQKFRDVVKALYDKSDKIMRVSPMIRFKNEVTYQNEVSIVLGDALKMRLYLETIWPITDSVIYLGSYEELEDQFTGELSHKGILYRVDLLKLGIGEEKYKTNYIKVVKRNGYMYEGQFKHEKGGLPIL